MKPLPSSPGIHQLVVCAVLLVPVAAAAQTAALSRPQFEVASIRQNTSSVIRWRAEFSPDGFVAEDASLADIIREAWSSDPTQQWDPMPAWTLKARFDIAARFDVTAYPHPTREIRQAMLQGLLAERFHLQIHQESRQFPLLALTLATAEPKFPLSAPGDVVHDRVDGHAVCLYSANRRGYTKMLGCTTADLAHRLSTRWDTDSDRIVVDRTGLTGRYDFELRWQPATPAAAPAAPEAQRLSLAPEPENPAPDLAAALWQQLGLKLVATQGPLDVMVIDHVELPTPN